MIRIQNSVVVASLAVSVMFAAATVQAEMMKFTIEMTGAAEVTLDTKAKTVTWIYTHEGLSGAMTAARIHCPATAMEATGPIIDTTGPVAQIP